MCLFVLIFEFPALFVLISCLSLDVENQSKRSNPSKNCLQNSVCWQFSEIEFFREKNLKRKCEDFVIEIVLCHGNFKSFIGNQSTPWF